MELHLITENLLKLHRSLTRNEIDFRVGSVFGSKEKAYATILAYKDARVDMNILDEIVGAENWQTKYERDSKGVLYCGIGIKCGEEWVWKWSNGIESNTEKEKGEASDAFKRAGFMWGIGRHLYDFPTIMVELTPEEFQVDNSGKVKATNKLRPNDWTWKFDAEFKSIEATYHGKKKFSYPRYQNEADKQDAQLADKVSQHVENTKPKDERITDEFEGRKMIHDVTTLPELKAAWLKLSPEVQNALTTYKDIRKTEIEDKAIVDKFHEVINSRTSTMKQDYANE